ncbi:CgeB family protein [Priestia flexa]|uniref:CgeB family protein n=1 Tax=Priestia flexa TaxID=86664 RepID=UPI003D080EF9
MKKKVLIIGPDYFGYNQSVASAFKDVGWLADIYEYKDNPPNVTGKIIKGFNKIGISNLLNKYKQKINEGILSIFEKCQPDLVLVVKGAFITADTILFLKKKCPVILWMMDSIFRIPDAIQNVHLFNYCFTFEKEDVKKLSELNICADFLPMAADSNVYYPLEKNEVIKDIDILFVGVLYNNRIKLFHELIKRMPHMKIEIYGKYTNLKKPISYYYYYLKGYKKYFKNKYVQPNQLNTLYNKSKIAVNIHHNQSSEGCNPRVFEILASKTFQLVDSNEYVKKVFCNNNCLRIFRNQTEFFEQISYYMNNENNRKEIVQRGFELILQNHTFKQRVKQIVDTLTEKRILNEFD